MSRTKRGGFMKVKEISEKISQSAGLVVAEYHGLTVTELQELRNLSAEKDVELKVYKNRIFKIAAKENGIEAINTELVGPNIFAFGKSDDISPAKVLAEFAKTHDALKLKAGTYEGKVIGLEEVLQVATLPSLEEALTMLATSMMAPLKYISVGMNTLVEDGLIGTSEAAAPAAEEVKTEEKTEETKEEAK
ncbi:50S ribosomal protein L10 [Mycoplasma todarodis]|uniref:Large ribosomal subunit protein uL10 n=2 Tax=Mycoplasma todarodis TaxID=1937191 RepID=A0A4R0XSB6_9MOLU|nr:50S ribosomal protein L10 [Mycoplasma todarodis]